MATSANGPSAGGATGSPRSLRLRIVNVTNEQVKVSLTLPVGLFSVAVAYATELTSPAPATTTTVAQQAETEDDSGDNGLWGLAGLLGLLGLLGLKRRKDADHPANRAAGW